MDLFQGNLFIGGISRGRRTRTSSKTISRSMVRFFRLIMRDKTNGRPRGFGFVVFADPSILNRVLQDVERLRLRGPCQGRNNRLPQGLETLAMLETLEAAEVTGPRKYLLEAFQLRWMRGFRQYFEDAVDRVLHKKFHDLACKKVEVKRALPKDANPGGGAGHSMGVVVGGIGFQGYGAFGGNSSSYDGRMDSNRRMQFQNGGRLPSHCSSDYSSPGYGYGPGNNSVGYGGYGSYGGANLGYGGATGSAYRNPNILNVGYGSGPQDSWSSQAPSGYGAVGYGNAGSKGLDVAPISQSLGGASGYGNPGYGGNEGSYANQVASGGIGGHAWSVSNSNAPAAGGDLQGNGGGNSDANGNGGYGQGWGLINNDFDDFILSGILTFCLEDMRSRLFSC
ncbi:RNA-binding (RRM/RBD/RNP motifs) family protein [Actinidia rufa]|uniref:RNA-binding (RRM/RBD/RNP motifs) family protein n=1 Tax=Actinidia rufa TaxID=165716 RepID=A0A7J0GJ04_9ERIC|nr:RNA-binding (RRM/RBD/RNP motifs) family protein [Actinidia rufa]